MRTVNGDRSKPWALFVGFHKPHPFWDVPQRFQDMYLESLPLPDHMDAPSDLPDVAYYSCTAINGRSDFGGPSCNDTVLNPQGCSYVMPNESYAQSKDLARPSDAMVRKVRAGYAVSTQPGVLPFPLLQLGLRCRLAAGAVAVDACS